MSLCAGTVSMFNGDEHMLDCYLCVERELDHWDVNTESSQGWRSVCRNVNLFLTDFQSIAGLSTHLQTHRFERYF